MAAVELAHAAGLPVVIKVHGCDVLWGLRQTPSRQPRTKEALCRADGVIAVSQDLARNVEQFGVAPDRVKVVYNGVDDQHFLPGTMAEARTRLGITDPTPLILCVANLFPVKGLDVLVRACAQLAAERVAFRCCVIGEGPQRSVLQRQIDGAGLTGRVELLGSRSHETLPDWYRAASVFALSSHSEGVPCVLMEAMACGTPFVATRVGGIPEVAHFGCGRLVPPRDDQLMADALRATLAEDRVTGGEPLALPTQADAAVELEAFFTHTHKRFVRRGDGSPLPSLIVPDSLSTVPPR